MKANRAESRRGEQLTAASVFVSKSPPHDSRRSQRSGGLLKSTAVIPVIRRLNRLLGED
jgi:hypothetical protein